MKQYKIVVEKHPDGYVAYPLGIKGVVVGQGDTTKKPCPMSNQQSVSTLNLLETKILI